MQEALATIIDIPGEATPSPGFITIDSHREEINSLFEIDISIAKLNVALFGEQGIINVVINHYDKELSTFNTLRKFIINKKHEYRAICDIYDKDPNVFKVKINDWGETLVMMQSVLEKLHEDYDKEDLEETLQDFAKLKSETILNFMNSSILTNTDIVSPWKAFKEMYLFEDLDEVDENDSLYEDIISYWGKDIHDKMRALKKLIAENNDLLLDEAEISALNNTGAANAATVNPSSPTEVEQPDRAHVRWGDMSDDEEDELIDSLANLYSDVASSAIDKTVYLPVDMPQYFPQLYAMVEKWCKGKTRGFNLVLDKNVSCAEDGFKHGMIHSSPNFSELAKKINELDRVALKTIHRLFSTLGLRPDRMLDNVEKDPVGAYVLSQIFKYHKSSEKLKKYASISLKGGDAGESIIRLRLFSLFETGSEAANMIWRSFHIMLNRMIKKEMTPEKVNEMLGNFSSTCFTSLNGMLNLSYKTVQRKVVKEITETNKKNGKQEKKRVQVIIKGHDVPKITLVKSPTRASEVKALTPVVSEFNKIEELCERLSNEITHPSIWKRAMIATYISDAAYSKVSNIRRILKQRKNAIRQMIQSDDKDNKVTEATWLRAQNKLLGDAETPEIKIEDLDLVWNLEVIKLDITKKLDELESLREEATRDTPEPHSGPV